MGQGSPDNFMQYYLRVEVAQMSGDPEIETTGNGLINSQSHKLAAWLGEKGSAMGYRCLLELLLPEMRRWVDGHGRLGYEHSLIEAGF